MVDYPITIIIRPLCMSSLDSTALSVDGAWSDPTVDEHAVDGEDAVPTGLRLRVDYGAKRKADYGHSAENSRWVLGPASGNTKVEHATFPYVGGGETAAMSLGVLFVRDQQLWPLRSLGR